MAKGLFKFLLIIAAVALIAFSGPLAGVITGLGTAAAATTVAGTIVASLVAAAGSFLLAYALRPSGDVSAQPSRLQQPPNTENKIYKFYGEAYTGGAVVDAEIKNSNDTMAIATVLGYYSAGEVITLDEVYRESARIFFNGYSATRAVDENNTTNNDVRDKIRVRVYAGGTAAANQIFPTTNKQPAYGGSSTSKSCQMLKWTGPNDHPMTGLIFAICEVDYDYDNNITSVGSFQFKLTSSITSPGDVFTDYFTNQVYGCGFPLSRLDTDVMREWNDYANQLVNVIDAQGRTIQQRRFKIDGSIDTKNSNRANLDIIAVAGGSEFVQYNNQNGKWAVVIGRPQTAKASVFDKDMLLNGNYATNWIPFTSRINGVSVSIPDGKNNDKTLITFLALDREYWKPNELENTQNLSLTCINNRARALTIAERTLKIMRFANRFSVSVTPDIGDLIIAGQVISITTNEYGFNNKLFRVSRIQEIVDQRGLYYNLALEEYSDDIFDDDVWQLSADKQTTGISSQASLASVPSVLGNAVVCDNPSLQLVNIYNASTGSIVSSNVPFGSLSANYATAIQRSTPWVAVEFTTPTGINYLSANITVSSSTNNFSKTYTYASPNGGYFSQNTTYVFDFPSSDLPKNNAQIVFNIQLFAAEVSGTPTGNSGSILIDPFIPTPPTEPVELILSRSTYISTNSNLMGANGLATLKQGEQTINADPGVVFTISATTGIVARINNAFGVPYAGQQKGFYQVDSVVGNGGSVLVTASYGGATYTRSMDVQFTTVNELVQTLPTTNNYNGRQVYLEPEGKLYRYVAIPGQTVLGWTASVNTADLTGSIIGTQIADGSISTPKLAALSVATVNLQAGAATLDKLAAGSVDASKLVADRVISTSAQIGDAVVNTLQIAGNAVTVPASVYATQTFTTTVSSTTPTGFCRLVVTSSGGQQVVLVSTRLYMRAFGGQAGGITGQAVVNLLKNGVVYRTKLYEVISDIQPGEAFYAPPAENYFDAYFQTIDNAPVGTVTTYSIQVIFTVSGIGAFTGTIVGSSTGNSDASIVYLETRR